MKNFKIIFIFASLCLFMAQSSYCSAERVFTKILNEENGVLANREDFDRARKATTKNPVSFVMSYALINQTVDRDKNFDVRARRKFEAGAYVRVVRGMDASSDKAFKVLGRVNEAPAVKKETASVSKACKEIDPTQDVLSNQYALAHLAAQVMPTKLIRKLSCLENKDAAERELFQYVLDNLKEFDPLNYYILEGFEGVCHPSALVLDYAHLSLKSMQSYFKLDTIPDFDQAWTKCDCNADKIAVIDATLKAIAQAPSKILAKDQAEGIKNLVKKQDFLDHIKQELCEKADKIINS